MEVQRRDRSGLALVDLQLLHQAIRGVLGAGGGFAGGGDDPAIARSSDRQSVRIVAVAGDAYLHADLAEKPLVKRAVDDDQRLLRVSRGKILLADDLRRGARLL